MKNGMIGAFVMLALFGMSFAAQTIRISDEYAVTNKLYVQIGPTLRYVGPVDPLTGFVPYVAGSNAAAYMTLDKYPEAGLGFVGGGYNHAADCAGGVGRVNGLCPA